MDAVTALVADQLGKEGGVAKLLHYQAQFLVGLIDGYRSPHPKHTGTTLDIDTGNIVIVDEYNDSCNCHPEDSTDRRHVLVDTVDAAVKELGLPFDDDWGGWFEELGRRVGRRLGEV